jgi:hypothetical protein
MAPARFRVGCRGQFGAATRYTGRPAHFVGGQFKGQLIRSRKNGPLLRARVRPQFMLVLVIVTREKHDFAKELLLVRQGMGDANKAYDRDALKFYLELQATVSQASAPG